MNIAIWIAQGIIAAMFLMAGIMKMTASKAVLKEKVGGWVDSYSDNTIKTIGFVEILGAIGLILPMVLNVLPVLTVAAAGGLALTMLAAMAIHLKRKENKEMGMNVVLLLVIGFVLVGRIVLEPII